MKIDRTANEVSAVFGSAHLLVLFLRPIASRNIDITPKMSSEKLKAPLKLRVPDLVSSPVDLQPEGINQHDRIVRYVDVEVDAPTVELNWIFADEALGPWVVVPRPIVVEARAVVLPARILELVRVREARDRRRPKWLIGVLGLDDTRGVGYRHGRPERIGQERPRPRRVCPRQVCVGPEPIQESDYPRGPGFLDWLETIVEEASVRPIHHPALTTPNRVVREARRHAPAVDRDKLVTGVPGVGVDPVARQISVQIVGQRQAAEPGGGGVGGLGDETIGQGEARAPVGD